MPVPLNKSTIHTTGLLRTLFLHPTENNSQLQSPVVKCRSGQSKRKIRNWDPNSNKTSTLDPCQSVSREEVSSPHVFRCSQSTQQRQCCHSGQRHNDSLAFGGRKASSHQNIKNAWGCNLPLGCTLMKDNRSSGWCSAARSAPHTACRNLHDKKQQKRTAKF